ncbi:UNVERIFIED_CONTAM: hypothetical protein Slati_2765900 [Sesamum latifolium]|uniref:Reverse transcriptase n=1 Tax=Sesamum latifolium TaxID=2727402 RepID=A0AAW2VZC7_9LAMI
MSSIRSLPKIRAERMKEQLGHLVHPSQNAFIPGRRIWDNIMLGQELMVGYNWVNLPPRCTLKVDFCKACDSVYWDFLLEMMRLFGFHRTFKAWIEECVISASFSILINGNHMDFSRALGAKTRRPHVSGHHMSAAVLGE